MIGITGSAGKTTTRVATSTVLEALAPGEVLATSGNLNNLIGVPMTLFGLLPEHRFAVVEMGTNQPGEIAALTSIAEPDVGVVTLIAAAHVEGFGSIEAIAREKAALVEGLGVEGVAIGNGDDSRVVQALLRSPARRRVTYGFGAGVDYRIAQREVGSLASVRLRIERASRSPISAESGIEFTTPLLGEAGALASAAALAAVEGLLDRGVSGETMSAAMDRADVGGGSGRLLPRTLADGLVVLDDSYNANPASMRASIEAAAEIARAMGRRLVLVLGEMRELGSASASGHDDVGRAAAKSGAAWVVAVAGEAARIADAARAGGVEAVFATDSVRAAEIAMGRVTADDFVLVKGSRGVATERVVTALATAHGGERSRAREGAA